MKKVDKIIHAERIELLFLRCYMPKRPKQKVQKVTRQLRKLQTTFTYTSFKKEKQSASTKYIHI